VHEFTATIRDQVFAEGLESLDLCSNSEEVSLWKKLMIQKIKELLVEGESVE